MTPDRERERELERQVPLTREAILALEPAALAGDLDAAYLYVAGCQSAHMFDRIRAFQETLGDRELPPWLEAFLDFHREGDHTAHVARLRDLIARSAPDLVVPRARLNFSLSNGTEEEREEAVQLTQQLLREAPESVWGYFSKASEYMVGGRRKGVPYRDMASNRQALQELEKLVLAEGPKGEWVQLNRLRLAVSLTRPGVIRDAYTALQALYGRPVRRYRLWALEHPGLLVNSSLSAAFLAGLARLPLLIPFSVIPFLSTVPGLIEVWEWTRKRMLRIAIGCGLCVTVGVAGFLVSTAVMHGHLDLP